MASWPNALVLALLLSGGATHARADGTPLAAFDAEYEVIRNGSKLGRAQMSLSESGGVWHFETHSHGTAGLAGMIGADILEQSDFVWRDGKPELRRYRYHQQAAWKERARSLDADPERGTIASDDGKQQYTLDFAPGVVDRNAVVLALAADVKSGAQELRYAVADKSKVDWQRYQRAGDEYLDLPAGHIKAVRIERIREKPGRTTTSWLAPALGWIPVQIVQREPDGETVELQLLRVPPGKSVR